jgi:hypothetical protein
MEKQYVTQPIKMMFDVQLGPDGHPWIRMQFATPGMSSQLVFPRESSEDVIASLTSGIRHAAKNATKRQADTVPPDFTNIKGAFDNGKNL